MKILITGSSGFLGQNLIKTLLENTDYAVVALSSHKYKLEDYLNKYPDKFSIIETSEFFTLPFTEIDILVNCAFPMKADGAQMAKGLRFITDLLNTACKNGVGAVINISSQSVYSSKRNVPATEESDLDLESGYGMGGYAVGKYAVELLTNSICNEIPHTNLRLASLIGVGYDQRVTNKLIDKIIAGEELTIFTGPQTYSFLDVRDAASAIMAVINSDPHSWAEVYNLGTSEVYSLDEIAEVVCNLYNESHPVPVNYRTISSDKPFNSALNCSRFTKDFQWASSYSLKKTMKWIYSEKIRKL